LIIDGGDDKEIGDFIAYNRPVGNLLGGGIEAITEIEGQIFCSRFSRKKVGR
jgi:hypothetical protein